MRVAVTRKAKVLELRVILGLLSGPPSPTIDSLVVGLGPNEFKKISVKIKVSEQFRIRMLVT